MLPVLERIDCENVGCAVKHHKPELVAEPTNRRSSYFESGTEVPTVSQSQHQRAR